MKIKELEAGLSPLTTGAASIIEKLRANPFEFSTETGKLREQLIANIHQVRPPCSFKNFTEFH